jgi:hypothetical protein
VKQRAGHLSYAEDPKVSLISPFKVIVVIIGVENSPSFHGRGWVANELEAFLEFQAKVSQNNIAKM